MPQVNTAQGIIVVDGPIAHIGQPASPITLRVEKGRVVSVSGESPQSDELRSIIETIKNADNIAEVGIGLNPACRRNGDFEEEKKARGNVHIAIGDNIFYGGDVYSPVHMDMVIYQPTVTMDGQKVVDQGHLLFDV
jgi:leucyl aminopeptidase (aminopeptidase T)